MAAVTERGGRVLPQDERVVGKRRIGNMISVGADDIHYVGALGLKLQDEECHGTVKVT